MNRIQLPQTPSIHEETLAEGLALYGQHPTQGPVAIVYCRRNRVGGRWIPVAKLWQLVGPIGVSEFLSHLEAGGHSLPDAQTVSTWVAMVQAESDSGRAN